MKNFLLRFVCLSVITCFFFANSAISQDAFFSNYELTPQLVNPSLTGLIDQDLRVFTAYRNLEPTIIDNYTYRSFLLGAETKVPFKNSNTSIGLAFFSQIDRIGFANYGSNEFTLSASANQVLGTTEKNVHSLSLGFNFGFSEKRISLEKLNSMSEFYVDRNKYTDFSTGVSWAFKSVKGINSELGFAIFHVNEPNNSLVSGVELNLFSRYVAHAQIEIPIGRVALIPSYLYMDQGRFQRSLVGLSGRLKIGSKGDWIQLSYLTWNRSSTFSFRERQFSSYSINTTLKLKDFLIGLAYDKLTYLESNSYEFSVNYFFNHCQGKNSTNN